MAVSQSTIDQVKSWYTNSLGREGKDGGISFWADALASGRDAKTVESEFLDAARRNGETIKTPAATPSTSGMLAAATATPSSTTTPSSTDPNVANWFRSALGRDGAAGGVQFWTDAAKTQGAEQAYSSFLDAARRNKEDVKAPATWQEASNYTGPASINTETPVDEWGRNVLGRELTPAELATWRDRFAAAGGNTDEGVTRVYNDFLQTFGKDVQMPMDWVTASKIKSQTGTKTQPVPTGPTTLDLNSLDKRVIDKPTETVQGQLTALLKADSPYMQQARYDAMRAASERGMLNSVMAASAGEDAAIRNALQIATPDAQTYGDAADYNTALGNQARMWNADQLNQFVRQKLQIDADSASRKDQLAQQLAIAQMQDATTRTGQSNQMTIAQLQDATSRWQTEANNAQSRYNTDSNYRQQADNNKRTMVNNIIHNMDLSPDRKAAMLEQLGEGHSAKRGPDGAVIPGSGLAGAVYVIDDVAGDLAPSAPANPAQTPAQNGSWGGS